MFSCKKNVKRVSIIGRSRVAKGFLFLSLSISTSHPHKIILSLEDQRVLDAENEGSWQLLLRIGTRVGLLYFRADLSPTDIFTDVLHFTIAHDPRENEKKMRQGFS